jgi:thioredoxin reductase (NADPH)
VYLSDRVSKVRMIVRGPSLDASMSHYLVERITAIPNVEVMCNTSVSALEGSDGMLRAIRCRSHLADDEQTCAIRHLFLFIGAKPNTGWLAGSGFQRRHEPGVQIIYPLTVRAQMGWQLPKRNLQEARWRE